jgi:hypothetical protein
MLYIKPAVLLSWTSWWPCGARGELMSFEMALRSRLEMLSRPAESTVMESGCLYRRRSSPAALSADVEQENPERRAAFGSSGGRRELLMLLVEC